MSKLVNAFGDTGGQFKISELVQVIQSRKACTALPSRIL